MPLCTSPTSCAIDPAAWQYTPSLKSARAVHASAPLALPLLLDHLPAESRLACAAVCRAWRAALADPALWLRLTLQPAARLPTSRVLAAASARAAGRLEFLDASAVADALSEDALLAALRANPALQTLRLGRASTLLLNPAQTRECCIVCRRYSCHRARAGAHATPFEAVPSPRRRRVRLRRGRGRGRARCGRACPGSALGAGAARDVRVLHDPGVRQHLL